MVVGVVGRLQGTKGKGAGSLSDFLARRVNEVADERAYMKSGALVEDLGQFEEYLLENSREWAAYESAAAGEKIPGYEVAIHLPTSMRSLPASNFFGGPRTGSPVFAIPAPGHPRWSDENEGGDDLDFVSRPSLVAAAAQSPDECERAIEAVLSILGAGTLLGPPAPRKAVKGELALSEQVCDLVAERGLDGGGNSVIEERWYRALVQGLGGDTTRCLAAFREALAAWGEAGRDPVTSHS